MELPPHIYQVGSVYVSKLTGRAIESDKIQKICNDYWANNPKEETIVLPEQPRKDVRVKKKRAKRVKHEDAEDPFKFGEFDEELENAAMEDNKPDLSLSAVDIPTEVIAEQQSFQKPCVDLKSIFKELDFVVGIQVVKFSEYWPFIKSEPQINKYCDYCTGEKILAMVAYSIHKHFPFENRLQFICDFCNRPEQIIKNHIAFGYKYENWYVDDNADMNGWDWDIDFEVRKYFSKHYELINDSEF